MRIDAEIHIHLHQVADPRVTDLLLEILTNQQTERDKMSQMDDKISELKVDIAEGRTVVDSAVTLLRGIPKLIDDAKNEALAAGATPEQLQAMTDLSTAVDAQTADLAAAIPANTPAEPTP